MRRRVLAGEDFYRRLTTYDCPQRSSRHHTRTLSARTIESFKEDECWQNFRTRKEDLPRLLVALKFDGNDFMIADNGCRFTKKEVMLIGLYRYCVVGQIQQVMGKAFNMDFSMPSRALKLFNDDMINNFSNLLTNNMQYWQPHFEEYAE